MLEYCIREGFQARTSWRTEVCLGRLQELFTKKVRKVLV